MATSVSNASIQAVARTISVAATLYAIKLIAGVHIDPVATGADLQRWEIFIYFRHTGETRPDFTVSDNLETKDVVLMDAGTLRGEHHEIHEVNEKLNVRRKVDANSIMEFVIRSDNIEGTPRTVRLDGILTYWFRVR